MRQASDYRMSMVWLAVVVCLLLGGGPAEADFTFGTPTKLDEPFNSSFGDQFECISPDGLELYLSSNRQASGGYDWDIYVSRRATIDMDWGPLVNLGPTINSRDEDVSLSISPDGLELYLCSFARPGGYGKGDVWMTRRVTKDAEWDIPTNLGPSINTSASEYGRISPDGLCLWIAVYQRSGGYGGWDLWTSSRETTSDAWSPLTNFGPAINSSYHELSPSVSSDGRIIFICEYEYAGPHRPDGYGSADILVATRTAAGDKWNAPINVGPRINTSELDVYPSLSPDGSTLYFTRSPTINSGDIYQAPVLPVVDFSGDGRVDGTEMCAMVNCWGTDDSLCDIAPMAWGDGIVDVEDLKVLAEYIGKDVVDGTLVAHWALDEAEGDIAYDSVGDNDGVLMGEPVWEPEGGMVDGALQFDGLNDCIETPTIIGSGRAPFSVLAWVKGGEARQVIISAADGSDWLLCSQPGRDGVGGKLATEFGGEILTSGAVIADGQWYRVGLVYDGTSRILYVDDMAVAEDARSDLRDRDWLHIGCGADQSPDTFFSGLIDDVRIYNRAVHP